MPMSLLPTEEELPQEPERATLQIRNETVFFFFQVLLLRYKELRLAKSSLRDQFLIPTSDPTKTAPSKSVLGL